MPDAVQLTYHWNSQWKTIVLDYWLSRGDVVREAVDSMEVVVVVVGGQGGGCSCWRWW